MSTGSGTLSLTVLDSFFWKFRGGDQVAVSAATIPNPLHDHSGLRIALQISGMDAMPLTESLWHLQRLKMRP